MKQDYYTEVVPMIFFIRQVGFEVYVKANLRREKKNILGAQQKKWAVWNLFEGYRDRKKVNVIKKIVHAEASNYSLQRNYILLNTVSSFVSIGTKLPRKRKKKWKW